MLRFSGLKVLKGWYKRPVRRAILQILRGCKPVTINTMLLCCCVAVWSSYIFFARSLDPLDPHSGNVQSSASSWGGRNPESPCTVWKHHKSHHFRTRHLPRFSSSTEFIHVMNETVLNAKTSLLVSSYTKNAQNAMLSLLTLMVFLVRTPLDFTCDELVSVTQSGRISGRLKRWNEAFAAFDAFETLPLRFHNVSTLSPARFLFRCTSSIRWLSPVVSRSAATVPWFTFVHHLPLIRSQFHGMWRWESELQCVGCQENYNGFGTYSDRTSAAVGAEQCIVDLQPPLLQADPVGLHDDKISRTFR